MNMTRLREECRVRGLLPDSDPPLEVSPGVFQFYATPLTQECHVSGNCRHLRYYAIIMGDSLYIQHIA